MFKRGNFRKLIVRINRPEKNDPQIFVGMVEEVGLEGDKALSNPEPAKGELA